MKFIEGFVVVLVSVILALLGVAVVGRVAPQYMFPAREGAREGGFTAPGAGEDAPILMAGGSLYIGTHGDHEFVVPNQASDMLELHDLANNQVKQRFVTNVEAVDDSGNFISKPVGSGVPITVIVTFLDPNNANNKDTITLAYDNVSTLFTINESASGGIQLIEAHRLLSNLLIHPNTGWTLTGIQSSFLKNNTLIPCSGHCSVVLHTCKIGDTCSQ